MVSDSEGEDDLEPTQAYNMPSPEKEPTKDKDGFVVPSLPGKGMYLFRYNLAINYIVQKARNIEFLFRQISVLALFPLPART